MHILGRYTGGLRLQVADQSETSITACDLNYDTIEPRSRDISNGIIYMINNLAKRFLGAFFISSLVGCQGDPAISVDEMPFILRFKAVSGDQNATCGDVLEGYGTNGELSIELQDLRFFISELTFYDKQKNVIHSSLIDNEFQYQDLDRNFATTLIDLTGTNAGACVDAIAGTSRINQNVKGVVASGEIDAVSFSVSMGIPLMRSLNDEGAPSLSHSPFDEMQWTWLLGMIDIRADYLVSSTLGPRGGGVLMLGPMWLENFYPKVMLSGFSLDKHVITLDLQQLLKGIDTDRLNSQCHGGKLGICAPINANFGIVFSEDNTVTSNAENNAVFSFE